VCVHACVRVCVCACVYVCLSVCLYASVLFFCRERQQGVESITGG